MDGGLFPEPKIKTGQIKNPSCLNLSVQTGGIFLLCEIIGMITEIVSIKCTPCQGQHGLFIWNSEKQRDIL